MKLENLLNDVEVLQIQGLLQNEFLKNAIKKVFLFEVYGQGVIDDEIDTNINFAIQLVLNKDWTSKNLSDEQVGKNLKNAIAGIQFVESGFLRLEKFNIVKENKPDKENPAR